MTLIILLVALVVERFLGSLQDYRRFDWLHAPARWMVAQRERFEWLDGPIGVLILVGLPAAVAGWLQWLLGGWSLILAFLFGLAVFIYCLGPRSFYDQAKNLVDALDRGDEEAARWYMEGLLDRRPWPEGQPLPKTASEAVFIAVCDRFLAVVFWFALLGPLGAVMYRAASELRKTCLSTGACGKGESGLGDAVAWLYQVLGWVPARLTAYTFAALGSFMDARESCRRVREAGERHWPDPHEDLLACAGCGALRLEEVAPEGGRVVCQSLDLARRSIWLWVVVIALFTLWGWIA